MVLHIKKLSSQDLQKHRADIAASFQEAAVAVLVEKTMRAAAATDVKDVTLSGGVAANSRLRELMQQRLQDTGRRLFYPSLKLCTDNAAMIAAAGYLHYRKDGASEMVINAEPYLPLVAVQPK